MDIMKYNAGVGEIKNWIVEESEFDSHYLGKCEAIFCQGNGYMGVRAALEEAYVGETRNTFVTGTFNSFDENEVTELPNIPDMTKISLYIDGQRFSLEQGKILFYQRTLNLKTGELIRVVDWESPQNVQLHLEFKRIVSLKDEHVFAMQVSVKAINKNVSLKILSGINGKVTNSGFQHFSNGIKRIYDNTYLEMLSKTTQSKVSVALHTAHRFMIGGKTAEVSLLPIIENREMQINAGYELSVGQVLEIEKICTIHTTRDLAYVGMDEELAIDTLKEESKQAIEVAFSKGYASIVRESTECWQELWKQQDIQIQCNNSFDQLAIRFALYHLNIMVKKDDNRVGIGAKALSGEGYKGHSFWDTEIFIFPYFMLTQPETARTLLEYRYKNLYGARKKAEEFGYEGAMYPWESAWIDDGEVTPLWGGVDVVTGKPIKILTGLHELHVTADIAFAVWQYYIASQDEEFMDLYGYEIIIDTAKFWASRLEWKADKNRYEITDVIGPDEYKERIDNNAYTNYLAHYNMKLALQVIEKLDQVKPQLHQRLNEVFKLNDLAEDIREKLQFIFLPKPDEETGIIPQFDGYFDLKHIDLTKYKTSTILGTIYNDYNPEQITEIQVLKQADLVVLFYLLDDLFDSETKKKNYFYYEERTLHDSSLSKATHCVLANDLGLKEVAYDFYEAAAAIDLGPVMTSSNAGIHSASTGGIWQSVVFGFGGVRVVGDKLRINPCLPETWDSLSFNLVWHGSKFYVDITQKEMLVTNYDDEIEVILIDQPVKLVKNETVKKEIN